MAEQLTLDTAQAPPQQLDGIAKAMQWIHMYGPGRIGELRTFTRCVGELTDAVDANDPAAIESADRALTDARLEWEPTVTQGDIDQAQLMHLAAGCTDCFPRHDGDDR